MQRLHECSKNKFSRETAINANLSNMQQQTRNIPSDESCKFAWPRVLDQYQYYDEEYEL